MPSLGDLRRNIVKFPSPKNPHPNGQRAGESDQNSNSCGKWCAYPSTEQGVAGSACSSQEGLLEEVRARETPSNLLVISSERPESKYIGLCCSSGLSQLLNPVEQKQLQTVHKQTGVAVFQ